MWLFGQICFPPLGRAPLMRQFRRRGHRRWKRSRGGAGGDGWSSERNGNWRLPHRPSDFWPLNMSISSRQKCKKGSFSCRALNPFSCIKLFFGCPQNDWWKTGQLSINRFELSFGSCFCSSQPFSIHWKVEYPYLALVFRWFDCPVMVIFFSSSIFFQSWLSI